MAYPIMKKVFEKRGIAAPTPLLSPQLRAGHAGSGVRTRRSATSGGSAAASHERGPVATQGEVKFLKEILNTEEFPLTVLDRPIESETAKIVENSYRATTWRSWTSGRCSPSATASTSRR